MLTTIDRYKHRVIAEGIDPSTQWRGEPVAHPPPSRTRTSALWTGLLAQAGFMLRDADRALSVNIAARFARCCCAPTG